MKKIVVGLISFCVLVAGIFGYLTFRTQTNSTDTSVGISVLQENEKKEVKALEKKIKQMKKEEKIEYQVNGGVENVFSLYDDYVFYGDSRVLHFVKYGFLPKNRIFADNTRTYESVSEWDEKLKSYMPSNIYVAYGNNDIAFDFMKKYKGNYGNLVESSLKHILNICPDAHIYVCAIIPPSQAGVKEYPHYAKVPDYNKQIEEVCMKMDQVTYINDDVLAEDGLADIYVEDQFHFKSSFYETWTKYIFLHMYDN